MEVESSPLNQEASARGGPSQKADYLDLSGNYPQDFAQRPPAKPHQPAQPEAAQSKAGAKRPFTTDDKFRALYNLLVRHGIITEYEMKQELLRLRGVKKPSTPT